MNKKVYDEVFAACQAGGMSNDEAHAYATDKAAEAVLAEATARYNASAPMVERRAGIFKINKVRKVKSVAPRQAPLTGWVKEYTVAIRQRILRLKHDGTTAMSADNLFNITFGDVPGYGAPRGTNAQWALRQTFNDIIRHPEIKPFILA